MFINKITICNLFAYYGEVSVEFRKQDGRNIYCIYGNNSFGKTSFIRCAKLLFLGTGLESGNIPDVIARFAKINTKISSKLFIKGNAEWEGILNKTALREGQSEFFVRFEGEFGDKDFTLTRCWKNAQSNDIQEQLTLAIDSNEYSDDEAQDKVSTMLSPNFVEFFFFDGEEIENISNNLQGKLREKIEDILQISPLDIIIEQIRKCRNKLKDSELQDKKQQNDLRIKRSEQESLESKIKAIKDMLDEAKLQQEEQVAEIKNIDKRLNQLMADSSREQERLISEKSHLQEKLLQNKKALCESLKTVVFVSNSHFIKTLKDELDSTEKNTQKSDIEAFKRLTPDISQIANSEIKSLDCENQMRQTIQNLFNEILNTIPKKLESKLGKKIGKIPAQYIWEIKEIFARVESNNLQQELNEIKRLNFELKIIQDEIDSQHIDEFTKTRQEELNDKKQEYEKRKNKLVLNIEEYTKNLNELNQQKDEITKEIYHLDQSINIERIKDKLIYLDLLRECIETYKNKLVTRLREELHNKILEKYKLIMPDDNIQDLEIDENFLIRLKDIDDNLVIVKSQSAGQKQILAICIFGALSELSHSQIPLILDTPLSRIDSRNRANIIKHYYAKGNQVIILPTDTEISTKEYQYIKPYIAGLYQISNEENRSHANIKEMANIDEIL